MRRQHGYIFIEILVSIILLSVGICAAAAVFIPATTNHALAADYTTAANLAQKQLELLKTWQPVDWETAGETIAWQDSDEAMPISLNGINYAVETKKVSPASVSNSLIEVTVTVSWSRNGRTNNVQYTAVYPK